MRLVTSSDRDAADVPSEVELVLARVHLHVGLRSAWLQHLEETRSAAAVVELDSPRDEALWGQRQPEIATTRERVAAIERALVEHADGRFARISAAFGLSPIELDLLQLLFAAAIEPRLAELLARLDVERRGAVTAPLAGRLFGHGRAAVLTTDSPLHTWELVHADREVLSCDPFVRDWLQGAARVDGRIAACLRPIAVRPPLRDWPLAEVTDAIQRSFAQGGNVRAIFSGPPGVGRRTLAANVLAELGAQPFAVDASAISEAEWPRFFMLCQRFAVLAGAGLVWVGNSVDRPWPTHVSTTRLQVIACREGEAIPRTPDAVDHRFELHAPGVDESLALWRRLVPDSAAWPIERLVAAHRLTVGEIVEVARHAPASVEAAETVARELGRGRLGELAHYLPSPFGWDDLVVPDGLRRLLQAFVFEATDRAAFWDSGRAQRLFPRGTGLVALMTGPPGTGKTMTAQVVARELGLDLHRIDLATVVSKYIGETAKNLRRIFQRAARLHAVLLFDEADAMFARRTELRDSHDRHANADTNYLLQLLEEYRGVALLASNRRNNIDPAFVRRVRYVLTFARPDVAQRIEIWRRVVGELFPDAGPAVTGALPRLGTALALSGAEIKNAALAAAFCARQRRAPVALDDLLVGIDRELAKEGKGLSLDDRRAVMRDG
jgi:DNA polymerase III delta prime subunit